KPGETYGILWYGDKGIAIDKTLTAASLQARLNAISGLTTVVNGEGTEASPWTVAIVSDTSTPSNSDYKRFELTTGGAAQAGGTVFTRTGAAATDSVLPANDRQLLLIPREATAAQFRYGSSGSFIEFALDGGALALETNLKTLTGITNLAVVAGKTATDPWEVQLLDAVLDPSGAYKQLEYAITKKLGAAQQANTSSANASQNLTVAQGSKLVLWYGTQSVTLQLGASATAAADATAIATALGGLGAFADINIAVAGTDAAGGHKFTFTLTPKDPGATFTYQRLQYATVQAVSGPVNLVAASAAHAHRAQEVTIAAGALTLWYGDHGIDVKFTGTPTAANIEAALETLPQVRNVSVILAGGKWKLVFIDADRAADGSYALLSRETFFNGATPLELATVDSKRDTRDAVVATQAFFLEDWQDQAQLRYGDSEITVTRGMSAAAFAEALEAMPNIDDVWVSGAGTTASPWAVAFLDAARDANGNLLAFQREVSVQRMSRAFDVTTSDDLQTQYIPASAIHSGTSFGYGAGFVSLAAGDISGDTTTQAANLQAKLRNIGGDLATVTVAFDTARYRVNFVVPAAQAILYNAGAGPLGATPRQIVTGQLQLPLNIAGATLRYNGQSTDLLLNAAVAQSITNGASNSVQSISVAGTAPLVMQNGAAVGPVTLQ